MSFPPERIVCLTEETVETLYLLGHEHRIAGVSGYAVRPPRVRREKPRVSAFISADIPKILALEPDLVLTFSDLQAEIVASLIREGVAVHAFNQRSVEGIFDMILTLGSMVGAADGAATLVASYRDRIKALERQTPKRRPKIYFEEWDDPLISGIGWISELIAVAGGEDCFPERASRPSARERIVQPADVIAARPDIIIGSWCGKKFRPEKLAAREGWSDIPAVREGRLHEIKSTLILQPGPAALTEGLDQLAAIIHTVEK